jgi:hypothetical protein
LTILSRRWLQLGWIFHRLTPKGDFISDQGALRDKYLDAGRSVAKLRCCHGVCSRLLLPQGAANELASTLATGRQSRCLLLNVHMAQLAHGRCGAFEGK